MKKLLFIAMLVLFASSANATIAPPTNIRLGVLQPNNTINLIWDASTVPSSWVVFFNGVQRYSFSRSEVKINASGSYSYLMQNLPPATSVSLSMCAQVPGQPISVSSSAVTFTTAQAPFSYFLPLGLNSSDKFTTTGVGNIYPLASPVQKYLISVCGEGGNLSSWSAALQGSLDGIHFTTFMTHDNGTPECTSLSSGSSFYPFTYLRVSMDSLSLGTATDALVIVNGLP